jgi:hypothetical protein
MALGGTYATGTVDATNGSKIVSGSGALWSDVIEGDWLQIGTAVGVIDSVSGSFNQINLKDNWAGTTVTGQPYRILKMSWLRYDPSLTQAKLRAMLDKLDAAGIFYNVENGQEPDNGVGEDGQYALQSSAPWKLWFKVAGIWVFQGYPGGLNWRDTWSAATTYAVNDGVLRGGSAYISIQAGNLNHTPESSPTYWKLMATSGGRYDIVSWSSDRPDTSELLQRMVMPTTVVFYTGLVDSRASAQVAATASTVFSLKKNGVEFGTLTFGIGATTGVFAAAADTSFSAGDILTVVAPNPRDATLADLSITVTGFR